MPIGARSASIGLVVSPPELELGPRLVIINIARQWIAIEARRTAHRKESVLSTGRSGEQAIGRLTEA